MNPWLIGLGAWVVLAILAALFLGRAARVIKQAERQPPALRVVRDSDRGAA